MSTTSTYLPLAIFDGIEELKSNTLPSHVPAQFSTDFEKLKAFLISYSHNAQTFNSFRREVERFAQWAWFVCQQSLLTMKRDDIEDFLTFCQKPPIAWIATKNVTRFTEKEGQRLPNSGWRPFVVTVPKYAIEKKRHPRQYSLSEKGFREILTILNCLYNFMIQSEWTSVNPIAQIKQKNRFFRKQQSKAKIRRISTLQWQFVMEAAQEMAEQTPEKHERTLFILSISYSLYLRISELVASARWIPTMNDFAQDHDGNWWFTTVGKGNKERQIAVSQTMLKALERWRNYLKLSPLLPSPNDNSPLIPKLKGNGPLQDIRHTRHLIQNCFDCAVKKMYASGFTQEADNLKQATVHWIRHTAISEDVKIRPREHVRDDAGHSSSSITDKYIDIDLRERHASAKRKIIQEND